MLWLLSEFSPDKIKLIKSYIKIIYIFGMDYNSHTPLTHTHTQTRNMSSQIISCMVDGTDI